MIRQGTKWLTLQDTIPTQYMQRNIAKSTKQDAQHVSIQNNSRKMISGIVVNQLEDIRS
jgi:hypothetical protein